jgi:hypothetical protein
MAEDPVLRHLGHMEALDGSRLTVVDTCDDGLGVWLFRVVWHSVHQWRLAD